MQVVFVQGNGADDGIGEDPELDAARFRRTDAGVCLVTQPMIDRLSS